MFSRLQPPSGPSSRQITNKGDAEDGEIDDQKTQGAKAKNLSNGQDTAQKDKNEEAPEAQRAIAPPASENEPARFGADASNPTKTQRGPDDSTASSRQYPNRINSLAENLSKPFNSYGNRQDPLPPRYPDSRQPPASGARSLREYHSQDAGRMDAAGTHRDLHRDYRASSPRRAPDGPPTRAQWEREAPNWNDSRGPSVRGGYDDLSGRPGSRDDRLAPRGPLDWNDRGPQERFIPRDGLSDGRAPSYQGRPLREPPMGMPRPSGPNMSHHPERPSTLQGDAQQDLIRRERDEPKGRPSRPPSPSRPDTLRPGGPSRLSNFVDGRNHHNDRSNGPRSHPDDPPLPTGPRGDRSLRSGPDPSPTTLDRGRELFALSNQPQRPVDPEHGRLSREPRQNTRQQDPNYGRLNPVQDVPAGPRGGRNTAGSANIRRTNETIAPPSEGPPTSDLRHAPPTRQSTRTTRRNGPQQADEPPSGPASAPATPASETSASDVAKVHPDRLREIEGSGSATRGTVPPINTAQVQSERQAQGPPSAMAAPPSGPRNAGPSPQHPVGSQGPRFNQQVQGQSRSGPADRRHGGERKIFQDVKDVLHSTGSERAERGGGNIRGRGGRSNGYSVPPSPTAGGPGANINRQVPPEQSGHGKISFPRGDENSSSQSNGPRENGRESRSERHHSSRSRSPHRGPGLREEDRSARREDQGNRRGSEREDRNARRLRDDGRKESREASKGRGPPDAGPGPEPEWDGDARGGGRRRDNRDDRESRDGNGSLRKRGRNGDEAASERGYGEIKRSRR